MSTIKDVADRAGVSIATVSRVLNSTGRVSDDLDLRVREAVKVLNYHPNMLARQLRRSESQTIGVLIPDSSNPYFAELGKGIEDVCFENGFTVVLCNTAENADKANSYLRTLYQQRAAGFVIVTPRQPITDLDDLISKGVPIILADRPLPSLQNSVDSISSDNFGGAEQAIKHLIALGHRRIGMIVGHLDLNTNKDRWQGVLSALEQARIKPDQALVFDQASYLPHSGFAGAGQLLEQADPPTAVFCFNDLIALGVLNYAQSHGVAIPSKLSVIGFDDIMLAAYTVPGLTTVAQPKYELGRRAAEMLLRRIDGDRQPPQNEVLPTTLIERGTTGRVRERT